MSARRRIDWPAVEAALLALPGLPYMLGARGPGAFDCWGLVLEVRRRLGLALPPDVSLARLTPAQVSALFHAEPPAGWARTAELTFGAIVLAPEAEHAGVLVATRILHARRQCGVVAWSLGQWVATFGALECWEVSLRG